MSYTYKFKDVFFHNQKITENNFNTCAMFVQKLFETKVNPNMTTDIHKEILKEELAVALQDIFQRDEIKNGNGICMFINTYPLNAGISQQSIYRIVKLDNTSNFFNKNPKDFFIFSLARVYRNIIEYTKEQIAIPPSELIFARKKDDYFKINLCDVQRQVAKSIAPNDKLTLMRHAIVMFYVMNFNKNFSNAIEETQDVSQIEMEKQITQRLKIEKDYEIAIGNQKNIALTTFLNSEPGRRSNPNRAASNAAIILSQYGGKTRESNKIELKDFKKNFNFMINDEKYNIVEVHHPNQFYAQMLQKQNDKWVTTNKFKHITINDDEMKLHDVQQTTWDNIENNWLSNSNSFNLSTLSVLSGTRIDDDYNENDNNDADEFKTPTKSRPNSPNAKTRKSETFFGKKEEKDKMLNNLLEQLQNVNIGVQNIQNQSQKLQKEKKEILKETVERIKKVKILQGQENQSLIPFLYNNYGKSTIVRMKNTFRQFIDFSSEAAEPGDKQIWYGQTYKDFLIHFAENNHTYLIFGDKLRYEVPNKQESYQKDLNILFSALSTINLVKDAAEDLIRLSKTKSKDNWYSIVRLAIYEKYNFLFVNLHQNVPDDALNIMEENNTFDDFAYVYSLMYTLIFNDIDIKT